ncbi:MAG: tetratricopeptide repeat protein [Bacteroidaceae bacterium]|nr:tetratricopeptide repeat protein [Bacteroidaceae bacterium]
MRRITLFSMAAASAVVLISCSKLGQLSSDNVNVTPTPLEAVGGEVPATISATFPEKYMKKKVTIGVTPVLKYEGGEVISEGTTFQGEKVQGNGTTVQYKTGGTYTLRASFPYSDALQKSDLYLRFDARQGNKRYDLPDLKVGYGVVSTIGLLANAVTTSNPSTASDAYQRIIKKKQEAQIKYLVNQANVRATELKTNSIQDFIKILQEINTNQEKLKLANIEVSAYASPEGRYDFNEKLAEKRQDSSSEYVNQELKKNKMKADVNTRFTAEDWEGFQELVSQSNIQDKDIILRVLSMYKDPQEREQQIRNMSVIYDELTKGVLPELRRARLIANYEVIGRSDAQIKKQFQQDAKQLGIEEILYGATLQNDNAQKKVWYQKATELFPNDARAFNNLANIAYQEGDSDTATNFLKKAKSLNTNSPEVATNQALLALAEGKVEEAEALLAKGSGADSYNEVLGNINLAKGNYAAAAANLSGKKTNSAALAQILNKDYAAAAITLAGIPNADATTSYLKAILGARQNDVSAVISNLQSAIQQDPGLAQRAAKDLEFQQFASQVAEVIQ